MINTGIRALAGACVVVSLACASDSHTTQPPAGTRSYRMGFSNFPPAPDTALARRSVEMWVPRSDAAIMHISPPWMALLAGGDADSLVRADVRPLVAAYRSVGLAVVVETDVTNGVDRTAEAPELVALGKSVRDSAVQAVYRNYVVALARDVSPDYLGLASETNLIRAAVQPAAVYPAVVQMANAAAADLQSAGSATKLYVSVQVEVAWGRLAGPGAAFVGIAQDRSDFPFIDALGLSSYPYLGGFAEPSELPADYFARIAGSPSLPVLITEGGWSSKSVVGISSTPAKQAAWISRAAALADSAHAVAWFQLDFTDIDLHAFGFPDGNPQVAPFVYLGLVDSVLTPKPALAVWDSVFALPRR